MKTSLFSVSFAGLWGQAKLSLEESIDKTASLGFDGIEIMGKRPHLSILDYKTFFEELKKAGFGGWVSYETCSPLRDGGSIGTVEAYAHKFLAYMKNYA